MILGEHIADEAAALARAQLAFSRSGDARRILAERGPGCEDVLSFQLSGGTTGMPKIIPRFHAEYLGHSLACARRYKMQDDDRIIWALPLLHNAAQVYVLIPVIAMGVSAVLMPRVDVPRMLELIERHRVTRAMSIGPIAPQIMAFADLARYDLSSLKTLWHLAEPCPAWLKDNFIAWLGPDVIWELYGGTEGQGTTIIQGGEWLTHRGSVGKPTATGEMKIVGEAPLG